MKNSRVDFALFYLNLELLVKLGAWSGISLAISLIFFPEFWASLGTMLSLEGIFGQYRAAPLGILGLCVLWLYLKRKEVWREMSKSAKSENNDSKINFAPRFLNYTLGLALVSGALLMPSSQDFLVFQVMLASLGVFTIIFGKAGQIPTILLGIYGVAISFPLIIERFAQLPYSISVIKPLLWILTGMGYPLQSQGQWVHLTSASGEPISVVITAACAGPVTMGVFFALFTLMMLDTPLPPKKAVWIFLFGVVGTWFQSFIRLIILMLVAYHLDENAMWTAHFWSIYILFPLWYLLFAYIYFRQQNTAVLTGK